MEKADVNYFNIQVMYVIHHILENKLHLRHAVIVQ